MNETLYEENREHSVYVPILLRHTHLTALKALFDLMCIVYVPGSSLVRYLPWLPRLYWLFHDATEDTVDGFSQQTTHFGLLPSGRGTNSNITSTLLLWCSPSNIPPRPSVLNLVVRTTSITGS